MPKPESEALQEIGELFRSARIAAGMTQEQVAELSGISRPRYRDIEKGAAACRATTLINIARALGLELMVVPQAMVPAIRALTHYDDDVPAFAAQPEDGA
jgi:transcriptional regulator with XRE-family HTH domain